MVIIYSISQSKLKPRIYVFLIYSKNCQKLHTKSHFLSKIIIYLFFVVSTKIYSLRINLDVLFAWARLLRMVWGLLKRVSSKG